MNKKQKANLDACYAQIENDLPILLTLFSKVNKKGDLSDGHISCERRNAAKNVSIQYSLQLQINDGKTPKSNIHIQRGEFYCFWVSHRYPLKNVDYYCLVCPEEPNIRIFIKRKDLKTGMNYFKFTQETIFSDGTKIWDYAGLRDQTINQSTYEMRKAISEFKLQQWKEYRWNQRTAQPLWLIKTYQGTPQELYTKASLSQIYSDNKHWNYLYKNKRSASVVINRNTKNGKWTVIANGGTTDVEYWVIHGDLNAEDKLLLQSFKYN